MNPPIVVHPPAAEGGRRVTAYGETLGTAYGLTDLIEFLDRTGLDIATIDLEDNSVIDWRGSSHEVWEQLAE